MYVLKFNYIEDEYIRLILYIVYEAINILDLLDFMKEHI